MTGFPVIDSRLVTFTVQNRGRLPSPPVSASISMSDAEYDEEAEHPIPALQPAQSMTRTVQIVSERNFFSFEPSDRVTAHVELMMSDTMADPLANNARESQVYHLARPILKVVGAVAEPRVRVNGPLRVSVTITNTSAIAAAKNIQLRHCLWEYDVGCWEGNWTAFGNVPIPDIAPGETRTFDYATAIPTTGFEEGYQTYGLSVCVAPRADTGAYMKYSAFMRDWACDGAGGLEVWPDFEACNPPLLGAQPVSLPAPNCGYYPVPPDEPGSNYMQMRYRWKLYYVFALDAVAGRTYRVAGVPLRFVDHAGRTAPDQDPAPNRVSFPLGGRYYLTSYGWEGVKTVTVTEQ